MYESEFFEKKKAEMTIRNNKTLFSKLTETKNTTVGIPGGDINWGGGSVYDDKHQFIISTTIQCNSGRDVIVTRLTDGSHGISSIMINFIPFNTKHHSPLFDGDHYVYFMESPGDRFGRMDTNTMTFEECMKFSGRKFSDAFSGCYHHDIIYVVDDSAVLYAYDVKGGSWRNCGISLPKSNSFPYVRLLSNPYDEVNILYFIGRDDNTVLRRIDVNTKTITEISKPPVRMRPAFAETYLYPLSASNFVLITALESGAWYAFSSDGKQWKQLQWDAVATNGNHNHMFYMKQTKSFYYHINHANGWECVQL